MKKSIWIIVIIALAGGLIAWRLASVKHKIESKKKTTVQAATSAPVNVVAAALGTVTENLVKTGTLVPFREADITATTGGTLTASDFRLGSIVRQGEVVAQIDNAGLQLRLEGAQLQQQKLSSDLKRYKVLLAGEATTETNVQEISYNLANAANQVAQISKQMADNRIKAPVSGQVVSKNVEAGEYVGPGTVLGKIVDISTLKADVLVSEADAYRLKTGQHISATTDLYPGKTFSGTVTFISAQADAAHNYQVQISLPNPAATPLKAGSFVSVDFIQPASQPELLIPRSALAEGLDNPYVYVVQDGKAVRRAITLGEASGNNLQVRSGLQPGALVVTNGQINLADGSAVSIVK